MVLKELILTFSTSGGCGALERTDFLQFLCWEGVLVMKELIFKSLCWEGMLVLKEVILTVSTLGGCGGFERIDF